MNKLNYTNLKSGDILQKGDQFSYNFAKEDWDDIEYVLTDNLKKKLFPYGKKITQKFLDDEQVEFRRPCKKSLKLILELKRELKMNQKVMDATEEFIYGDQEKANREINRLNKYYEPVFKKSQKARR